LILFVQISWVVSYLQIATKRQDLDELGMEPSFEPSLQLLKAFSSGYGRHRSSPLRVELCCGWKS